MKDKLKGIVITGVAIVALAIGGAAIAGATNGDNGGDQKQITGGALARASKVALAQTGADRVTDTELRDEEGFYEVEVERKNASRVDVHLDRNFNVIDTSPDGAGDGNR
jgi:uncharacterized membrane protein YkoI